MPAPGYALVVADYSQIELRVAAHLAPCEAMRAVFRAGRVRGLIDSIPILVDTRVESSWG